MIVYNIVKSGIRVTRKSVMAKKRIAVLTSGWSVDYVLSVLSGMEKICRKRNADLYIFTCYKSFESDGSPNMTGFSIFDLMNPHDYDGIVFMPNLFNDREMAEKERLRILKSGIPAITINEKMDGLSYVISDNYKIYKNLVCHLIEKHHITEFAFIGGPDDTTRKHSNFMAFREALIEHNIPIPEENIFHDGDWSFEFAYKKAQELFSRKKKLPHAVVCVNDCAAIAVIKSAVEHQIDVPNDLKVIGFDDISFASCVTPSISTVNMRADKMGEEAIKMLLEPEGIPASRKIRAVPYYRQSCGCVREITGKQKIYSMYSPLKIDASPRFASHLRHIENVFIQNETISDLENALQKYFERRHSFEGTDFAIMIKEEVIKSLVNVKYSYQNSTDYGKKMHVLVNINEGKAVPKDPAKQIIATRDLIPESMKEDKPCTFLFIPVFSIRYLQGYYVAKNSFNLLIDKVAYNWSRDFGASIEKFRQTVGYKLMSEQLTVLSTQDALSGLLNRTGLDIFAQDLFFKNNMTNKKTLIMFVDINDMKIINDRYGHLHGDLAVKTVAEAIKDIFPKSFLAIRYGGDEFVIIGTINGNGKTDFKAKLRKDLALRTKNMSLPYSISVSLGIKVFSPDAKAKLMDAIEEVDEIMYKEKEDFHRKKAK